MNADTQRIQAITTKREAGSYIAFTYGPGPIDSYAGQINGEFNFIKVNGVWTITHFDFTDATGVTRLAPQKTLKEAHRLAERRVRELPANVARRRELALEGARPISG